MNTPNQKLRKSAYELLIQATAGSAIYMLDLDGRVISWNPGAERIKGYTAGEIIGEHFSRFYTDEERRSAAPERSLKTAAETGQFTAEAWQVRKDGSRFWAMVAVEPIRQDGELVGFAMITRDITEQREAQLAALETESRFRLLIQSVTDYAIFMLDLDGRVSNWNSGAERIKGYAASEIVGSHFSRFYTLKISLRACPQKHSIRRAEMDGLKRKDGGLGRMAAASGPAWSSMPFAMVAS
ncbi:PAS domain-containing protein [Pseudoroseomonas wenyumeiae]